MSHRSQTEQARGAWGRDTKTGRGKKAGGDRARNTEQEVNRAGFEAQGTEPSREMHRGVWGNLFSDTLSPHFSPLGQKHQGQAQKTFPNPITTNYKPGARTLCCKPITLFSQFPTPTPDNTHRALYTNTHTHTHTHTWSLKLREPDVNTGVRCRVHAHTYTNLCLTDFQRQSHKSITYIDIPPTWGKHRHLCTHQLHPHLCILSSPLSD